MQLSETRLELAAVTEQRDECKAALQSADNHNHEIATKLEIVTEQLDAASAEFYRYHGLWDRATKQLETVMYQRDRLAEALRKIQRVGLVAVDAFDELDRIDEIVDEALADVKGGSDES